MSEFITVGEPLVVFCSTQPNCSIRDSTNFNKVVGGAELNVAIGVSRLGHTAQYISQVGDDPQGQFIQDEVLKKKVGTKYLTKTSQYLTGYQMKQLVTHGDPSVFNFRKDSAASHLTPKMVSQIDLSEVRFAHLTGILPAISKSALTTSLLLAKNFNRKHITLIFDPNLRPQLWPNQETMVKVINTLASYADVVLPGQNEGKILTGSSDPEEIANFYLKNAQTKAVFVKVGAKGSYVKAKTTQGIFVPGFKVEKVVDTVGAGDGFALGVITALLENKSYIETARRGNAVGALQVQTHGDNDGYPTREQLADFYKEMESKNYAFV